MKIYKTLIGIIETATRLQFWSFILLLLHDFGISWVSFDGIADPVALALRIPWFVLPTLVLSVDPTGLSVFFWRPLRFYLNESEIGGAPLARQYSTYAFFDDDRTLAFQGFLAVILSPNYLLGRFPTTLPRIYLFAIRPDQIRSIERYEGAGALHKVRYKIYFTDTKKRDDRLFEYHVMNPAAWDEGFPKFVHQETDLIGFD